MDEVKENLKSEEVQEDTPLSDAEMQAQFKKQLNELLDNEKTISDTIKSLGSSINPEDLNSDVSEEDKAKTEEELKEAEKFLETDATELDQDKTKEFLFGKSKDEKIKTEDINNLLSNMKNMIGTVETMWSNYQSMYKLGDKEMKTLTEFNLAHRDEPSEEELAEIKAGKKKFDSFNGLDKLTEDDVKEIFGTDSEIISKKHEDTVKTIKEVLDTFYSMINSQREFRNVYDQYMDLIESNEFDKMEELKQIAIECGDEERKKKILEAYDVYYATKYLDFLRDEIDPDQMKYVLGAYTDENKVTYQINRGKEKLEKLGFSQMFVLELSKFEDRFLDEKYKKQSNILLAHFLNMVVYGDLKNPTSIDRTRVVAFVIILDRLIRNRLKPEIRERVLGNLIALEDQYEKPVEEALVELKARKEANRKRQEEFIKNKK